VIFIRQKKIENGGEEKSLVFLERKGLCDVGEFEKRPPETEAQLKN
jgi:hypothetical protein